MVLAALGAPEATGATGAAPERRAFRSPTERVEARLAYIRTALKITSAQQAQWDTFANVLRKHASDMDQRIQKFRAQHAQGAQRPDPRNVSAIERLERMQQRTAARAARMNEVLTAAKPLYASLSTEQKQVADEMISRQGHHGHRGHHRGMHRGA
jgi:DNA anti-recombination protein RmuC